MNEMQERGTRTKERHKRQQRQETVTKEGLSDRERHQHPPAD